MLRAIYSILTLVVITPVLTLLVYAFYLVRRSKEDGYRMIRLWANSLLFANRVRVTAYHSERIPQKPGAVYMSNHRSNSDIPILMSATPVRISFVSKASLKHIPFLGWSMRIVDMVFIDRSRPERAIQSLKDAASQIRTGTNIIIFPEGTRSRDGKNMGPFKKGGFHLAMEAGVPIQPVIVVGSEKVMPRGSAKIFGRPAKVFFGEPILPRPEEPVEELMSRVRGEMQALLQSAEESVLQSATDSQILRTKINTFGSPQKSS